VFCDALRSWTGVSLWADHALDWKAVRDLVDRSYRVVALSRMIVALDGRRV
jgi:hypothetical protein